MRYEAKCTRCQRSTSNLLEYRCSCGSPLKVNVESTFSKEAIKKDEYTLWRYRKFFPYIEENQIVSLGEGWTPLIKFAKNVYFKLDFLNPTGSFKDRGSTMLISAVHKLIREMGGCIAEDSSGNAGASVAAYAARAGLKARIYVPATVSGQKFNQIMFYGAQVERVEGGRSKVAAEAQKPQQGKFYIGHIWHPIFSDGIRTLTYEIFEQLDWTVPNLIYLPVSAGTLLLGVIYGFENLADSGIIKEFPRIVACQTKQVSPLYHKFKGLPYTPPEKIDSIADALISTDPPLLDLMVEKLRKINGEVEIVDENEIYAAFIELARNGFFVEPSSAVVYAAYRKHVEGGKVDEDETAVIVLTGFGLKSKLKPQD
ncbi:threonine synthase [Candidatus Bathyarchaeota archaeon]|nr:MAG: threonine synthase [Candidatus Bathyarchaeota archaeon]